MARALLLPLLLLGAGVVVAQETATGLPEPGSFEQALADLPVEALHQVTVEDNLHLIAAYYYGDARQWPKVYTANRALIGRNPHIIHKGQVLTINLPAGWAPLEPYGHFLARVRAAGIPGLTAPTEAGGGKAAVGGAPIAAAAPVAASRAAPEPPAAPEPAPPKSY